MLVCYDVFSLLLGGGRLQSQVFLSTFLLAEALKLHALNPQQDIDVSFITVDLMPAFQLIFFSWLARGRRESAGS